MLVARERRTTAKVAMWTMQKAVLTALPASKPANQPKRAMVVVVVVAKVVAAAPPVRLQVRRRKNRGWRVGSALPTGLELGQRSQWCTIRRLCLNQAAQRQSHRRPGPRRRPLRSQQRLLQLLLLQKQSVDAEKKCRCIAGKTETTKTEAETEAMKASASATGLAAAAEAEARSDVAAAMAAAAAAVVAAVVAAAVAVVAASAMAKGEKAVVTKRKGK